MMNIRPITNTQFRYNLNNKVNSKTNLSAKQNPSFQGAIRIYLTNSNYEKNSNNFNLGCNYCEGGTYSGYFKSGNYITIDTDRISEVTGNTIVLNNKLAYYGDNSVALEFKETLPTGLKNMILGLQSKDNRTIMDYKDQYFTLREVKDITD